MGEYNSSVIAHSGLEAAVSVSSVHLFLSRQTEMILMNYHVPPLTGEFTFSVASLSKVTDSDKRKNSDRIRANVVLVLTFHTEVYIRQHLVSERN